METIVKAPRDFLTRQVLAQLDIPQPTPRQIATMQGLLQDRAIVLPTQATCNRLLNAQESACLFWAARGKGTFQTAALLGITHNTVRTYVTRLKAKLDARTMAQAVYEALRFYIIWPKEGEESRVANEAA